MKYFFRTLLVTTTLLITTINGTTYAANTDPVANSDLQKKEINIIIYGTKLTFSVPPVYIQTPQGDVTMVEFRTIFEKFGLEIGWDEQTQTVKGQKKDLDVELQIGNGKVKVNGQEKELQFAPFVIDGHTMVPLRFVGEVNGGKVEWDDPTKTVTIDKKIDEISYHDIKINGKQLESDAFQKPSFIIKGETFVDFRSLAMSLQNPNITYGENEVRFQVGDKNVHLKTFVNKGRSTFKLTDFEEQMGIKHIDDTDGNIEIEY